MNEIAGDLILKGKEAPMKNPLSIHFEWSPKKSKHGHWRLVFVIDSANAANQVELAKTSVLSCEGGNLLSIDIETEYLQSLEKYPRHQLYNVATLNLEFIPLGEKTPEDSIIFVISVGVLILFLFT